MKTKLLISCIVFLFVLCSCNNDRIELEITHPKESDIFHINQSIEVDVTATTKKGRIIQVQLTIEQVDYIQSLTATPYNFTIPPYTFEKEGEYTIAIMAYSSEGVVEGDGVRVKIIQ
jgi:hypothetical protein